MLLASWLLAVPFVFAGTYLPGSELAPGLRPPARAAALPACTIIGTAAAETLVGTRGDDVICALGGDDTVLGRGGDDVLFGSTGNDVVVGGRGNDRLYGHVGTDRLSGGRGRDFLQGGGGPDRISGGSGSDIADYRLRSLPVRVTIGQGANDGRQGEGDDVRRDVERVRGGHADDTLVGNGRANTLHGGDGDDSLKGKRGNDRLGGGGGVDRLDGRDDGSFVDRLRCGPGTPDKALANARDRIASDCEDVDQPNPPQNRPPTDILLSSHSVAEGRPAGTVVGTLSAADQDAGDSHTFALVSGEGDADNPSFAIVGDQLRTAAVFDFESKSSYSIRVRTRDDRGAALRKALTITVTDVAENHAPNNVSLSPAVVAENEPIGTTVGSLAATDADAGDSHTFAFVAGAGDADNTAFTINGGELRTAQTFNFESRSSFSIRVAATDAAGATFAKALEVTVGDVNEAPTGLALSNDTLPENEPVGTPVGDLSVSDVDAGQSHAFALVAGAGDDDNGKFEIDGSTLKTAAVLDFEDQASYSIRVRATDDGTPALAVEAVFTITVTDTLEPPAADPKSATTDEDTPVTITLSATDPEGDDVASFDTSAASHGTLGTVGAITCSGSPKVCTADVVFTPDADFNGAAGFSYAASDGAHTSAPAAVSITVNPVNDTPVATPGSRTTDEDTPLALDLAALVDDVETDDADLTYEIVDQPADGTATATTYTPAANFNGSDSLTYMVTDRGDPDDCGAPGPACDDAKTSTIETVSITVNPVNDAPQAPDGTRTTDEDTPVALDLAALASDVETSDANLSYAIVTPPAHGTASATTYTPEANFNGTDTLEYEVTDRGDPDNCSAAPCDDPSSATGTITITVGAVNDAPVNIVPAGPVSAPQGANTPLTGLSVADVDAGTDDIKVTFAVAEGTLTVSTSVLGGVSALQVVGNGTNSVVVTASQEAIRATLLDANGLVYHAPPAFSGPDPLTMTTDDLGHNGSGGPKTDIETLAIVVNSPPVAAAQSVTTNEDAAKAITLSASDADGDALSFAEGTLPAHGSLGAIGAVSCTGATPNVCSADVLYTPAADYNGPDSFTFTANDGTLDSDPATVSITIDPVNDAPQLQNIEGGALAYAENDPATPITATTTVADVDSANFDTGTLTVDYSAGGQAEDRLEIRNEGTGTGQIGVSGSNVTFGGTLIGTFTGGTGTTPLVVTLNASATPAAVQALVRNVTYRNVSENPSTTTRTARFALTDGDGGTSAAATRDIAVATVDDAPVITTTAGSLAHVEGDGPEPIDPGLTVTDVDSPNLASATVQLTGNYANLEDVLTAVAPLFGVTANFDASTGTLTLTGATTIANYQAILRAVTYENTSQAPSSPARTVTFKASDGATESAGATKDISVIAVDDAPTVTASAGSTAYTEQAAALTVDSGLALSDVDGGPNPTGATVDIVSPVAGDTLSFTTQSGISGSFASGVLTLSGSATLAQYETALRSVQFSNLASDAPGTSRSIRFQLTGPVASNTSTKTIAITEVNDAPATDPTDAAGSALEQIATAVDAGIVVSDPDSANLTGATVQITGNFQSGQDTLQFTNQNGITGGFAAGTLTLTGTATVAQYQTALRSVTYTNTSDTPSTLTRTFTFRVTDDGTPGLQSAPLSRDFSVVPVNDAPTDAGESQAATGNTRLEVELTSGGSTNPKRTSTTGNLLDNAADVDDAAAALSVDTATVSDPPNGTVSVNADGSYVYTPDAGFTGADSFTYKVKDDENAQSATSTVTITVANRVWYVKNDFAGTPDGRSETPFTTLDAADNAATATGDTIYVLRGTGTTGLTDTVDLLAQQRLLGQAVDLVVGGTTLFTGTPANRPPLSGMVNVDDANTISGVSIAGSGAPAISGATGDAAGTIADVTLSGGSGGLDLNGTSGAWDLSELTVNTTGGTAVNLNNAGTVNMTPAGTISLTSAAGPALTAAGTALSGTIDSVTTTSSATTGISLTNTTGSLTLDDVNLSTSGTALTLNNANNATVNNSGDADVNSTGTAINLTNGPTTQPNAPDVALDQVSSSGGTVGINIDGIGAGTFSAVGGALSGHTSREIDVNGGSGSITYQGTLNDGSGATAEITGRSGGAVALSGAIADNNDAGGGIILSGNTGGSTTFSNASKVLNTGASDAVSLTGSDGHTLNLTGGGLDIDTTTGQDLVATTSGTINVAGTGNSATSTTGRAINVQNTDFGSSGVTFQSVSANGAPNGILLNNTGTTAGMTITGTAANNSGGSIQNTTQHGVSLTSTDNFSANELSITGANMAGVDGTQVTNFTYTNGEILNAGDSLTDPLHGSIAFNDQAAGTENNIDGTLVITGNLLKDHYGGGVDVFNRNGTISDATVSNNTIDSPADEALSREDAISFNLFGNASTVASLTKAQIEDNVITDHPSGNGITILGAQTNTGAAPTPTIGVPGSATNRILIDGNLLTGDPTNRFGGAGIQAGVEGRGQGNFDITNNGTVANPIKNVGTHGIAVGNSGSSTVDYLIEGNRVDANNFEAGALGIRAATDKHIMADGSTLSTPTMRTIINNNVVRNTTGGGIRVLASNSNGTSEVKVTNNDVANGGAGTFPIRVENGSSADASFDPTMCATISGNTTAANGPSPGGNTFPGIGLFKRSSVAANYQFGIVGLSPSPSTNTNTESFVFGLNPNLNFGGGFYAGKRVSVDAGDNFVSCTHPPGF